MLAGLVRPMVINGEDSRLRLIATVRRVNQARTAATRELSQGKRD